MANTVAPPTKIETPYRVAIEYNDPKVARTNPSTAGLVRITSLDDPKLESAKESNALVSCLIYKGETLTRVRQITVTRAIDLMAKANAGGDLS